MSEIKKFKNDQNELEYIFEKRNSKKLVILIHGYGANMHDLFDLSQYLDREGGYDFIFPNGPIKIQMGFGYEGSAWFPIDMSELEKHIRAGTFRSFSKINPEGLKESLALLKDFIVSLEDNYDEIILGGFSQGAMLTSLLLKEFKTIKKALLFSGNLLAKELFDSDYSHLQFVQSHGTKDPVLGFSGAKELYEELINKGAKGEFISFAGGHEISLDALEAANKLLLK